MMRGQFKPAPPSETTRAPTEKRPRGGWRRYSTLGVTAAAALGGLAALAWPFVCPTSSWHWDLRDAAELAGARVNADLLAIDGRGALLSPQGTRPISIITPPLALPDDCGHIVSVRASLPGVPGDSPRQARVILLWQTEPVEGFS